MTITITENISLTSLAAMIADYLTNNPDDPEAALQENRFNAVIARYEGLIKRICFSFASSGSNYEDLRQDVLINLWRGLSAFQENSSLSTWIYRVAFNTCVSTIRRNRIRESDKDSLFSHLDIASDDNADRRENIEHLHYLISCLNNEEKALILLWLDERKYEEISEITGIPRNTVATRLRRIKEKLTKLNK